MAIGNTTASNPAPSATATIDPIAEQNKAIKQQNAQNQQAWQSQQPMIEGNNQANFVPLNKSAYNVNNQQMSTSQGNEAVLGKLQQTVLGQAPSEIMPLLQQKTASYLQDPNLGYNPAANRQMQLEQYDRQASQAMEAARQQLGDTSQSGELKNEFLKNILTNTQNRGDLARKLETEAATLNQTNLLNALAQGRAQVGTENETTAGNIANLVAARGAAEGERAQTVSNEQQMAILEKTFGQDMAKLVATQDWQGAQADLDRQAAIAKQTNDINAQQNLVKLQSQLDLEKLKQTQDWQSVQNDVNRQFELAKQSNDINAQSSIVDRQLALDKWKQENGQKFTAEQNAINNALQLTLKDKDFATQSALMELKGKIDTNQLMTQQDFQATQSELDRKQKEFLAKGDWQSALDVVQQKGAIDLAAQKAQQDFTAAQTKASQTWQTAERISTQDYDKAKQVIDYQMKTAMQNLDIQAQKDLKDQQAKIDLKMKTQDLSNDKAKMYLQSQLDNAKANNDVERQKQILSFQASNDFARMDKQFGYDTAMANLDAQLKSAESKQDFQQTQILQKEKFAQDAIEAAKDRALQQAQIDLQAKGVDMQALNQQHDYLQAEIDAGRADPSSMDEFVNGVLSKAGVTIKQPDPDAERKAADKQYNDMLDQYGTTHPELVDPITKELTQEGKKKFNEHFNSVTYGELTTEQEKEKENAGYLSASDIAGAAAGDKFNFEKEVDYNGVKIPQGKYSVKEEKFTSGNTFFGTKRDTVNTFLVNQDTGEKYQVNHQTGPNRGNIISNLWA